MAAGCPSPPQRLPDNGPDPILGPEAPGLPKKGGAVTPSGPEAKLNAPLPLTQQTSSTAAMAGGGPLKGGRETIAIPVNDGAAGKKAWQENDGSKTVLKTPQPIAQGQPLTPVPNLPYGTDTTLQKLRAQLKDRGLIYEKQDPIPGGVRFDCIVAYADGQRRYTVEAADAEAAIRAVLAKIDQAR